MSTDEIEALRASQAKLVEALDGLVLVCGRTGHSLDDFEEQAEAFHRETGYMRPGKDAPDAYGGDRADYELRHQKYREWVQSKIVAGRAALDEKHGDQS